MPPPSKLAHFNLACNFLILTSDPMAYLTHRRGEAESAEIFADTHPSG